MHQQLPKALPPIVRLSGAGPFLDPGALAFAGTILSPASEDSSLSLKDLERGHIIQTLNRFDGHKSETARALGIDRKTLREKLKRYNIE